MLLKAIILFLFTLTFQIVGSEHGIYLQINKNIKADFDSTVNLVFMTLSDAGFKVIANRKIATPDIVRENVEEHCGFRSHLFVFTNDAYTKNLTSFGNKYLVASFLKAAVYEDEYGIQINIADPETINRIVFNDKYENEIFQDYVTVIKESKRIRKKILTALHSKNLGKAVEIPMEPIRASEDLAESSKDMFMMVGPMTFFNDEDQFPIIYESTKNIAEVKSMFEENLKSFIPTQEDVEYRLTKNPEVLKWQIICETSSPDNKSLVLGISRTRTEGLSFHIAGSSRETETNLCPGIDHTPAYPIEVLLIEAEGKTKVYTAREMFRMDMYFWDAGMSTFMNHMSMPSILDESIGRALLGKEYNQD